MLHVSYPHQRMLLNSEKSPENKNNVVFIGERIAAYDVYVKMLRAALSIDDIFETARVLNAYMDYAKACEFLKDTIWPNKSKYYSSILEELPVHIVKNILEDHLKVSPKLTNDFYLGCYDCVVRVGAGADGKLFPESKMVDFTIALKNTSFPGKKLYVPLFGLEVKRYLDKTMFHTVEHTRRLLSEFRPKTYYGFLVEDEARAKDVVDNSTMYDREFTLTGRSRLKGKGRNPIGVDQLQRFVTSIRSEAIAAVNSTII